MSVSAEPQRGSPTGAPDAALTAAEEASIGELSSQLSEQMSRLVRDEIALAQAEAKQRAKEVGIGVGMFGAGGAFAFFATACVVAAAVIGLANVTPGWLAALIVAAVLFAVAGVAALTGKKNLQHGAPPVPTEAVQSVRADAAAVREAVRR